MHHDTVVSLKMSNYSAIIQNHLDDLYTGSIANLEQQLPCIRKGDSFLFKAFGLACRVTPQGIFLDGQPEDGPRGVVIALYVTHRAPGAMVMEPCRAFKELPDSRPYTGAFTQHTETILVPHVPRIEAARRSIIKAMNGEDTTGSSGGDFAFRIRPLPKIALCYIFYRSDADFPASATCLFSCNANRFMPLDGLADMAEYTSRRILELIG